MKSSCCCRSASPSTRVVNFINDELVGQSLRSRPPWCIEFPNYTGYRYPSQIFEGILDILVLPILLLIYRRRPADGVVAWTWFTLYGITRSIAEIWREPGFTVDRALRAANSLRSRRSSSVWDLLIPGPYRRGKHTPRRRPEV